jgi:ribosomal protein S24E
MIYFKLTTGTGNVYKKNKAFVKTEEEFILNKNKNTSYSK